MESCEGGEGRVEQKFRDLMQISSSSANKIHRRRCKASQNLRLAVPRPTLSLSTYGVRLFFSSFLFLRAIVLLIQTEYSSYCSSLLSHASRYISQAGKLNLAQGEREREKELRFAWYSEILFPLPLLPLLLFLSWTRI